MAKSKLVGLLLEAWNDMDRVLADVRPSEATLQRDGGSSFAWTAGTSGAAPESEEVTNKGSRRGTIQAAHSGW